MIDLDTLERLAKGATHKEWYEDQGDIIGFVESEGEECCLLDNVYGFADDKDRAFIGTASPQTILKLCKLLRGAREVVKSLSSRHEWQPDMGQCICEPHEKARAWLRELGEG